MLKASAYQRVVRKLKTNGTKESQVDELVQLTIAIVTLTE